MSPEIHAILRMICDQSPKLPLVVLITSLLWCHLILPSQSDSTDVTPSSNTTEIPTASIEKEVLGPLRVWHVVFIVVSLLLIAMIAVFCCVDIRVPRSHQEIEKNYKKRLLNQRYVRMLERSPDELMRPENFGSKDTNIAVVSSKDMESDDSDSRQTRSTTNRDLKQVSRNIMSKASSRQSADNEDDGSDWRANGASMLGMKGGKNGGPAPLAINPRDILAVMAQQRKTAS